LGRRGPGDGLRQARSTSEAEQWLRLFDALASDGTDGVLPFLGLRIADAAPLRAAARDAAVELQAILAETRDAASDDVVVALVNDALSNAYAGVERRCGARVARGVFLLCGDGFPPAGAAELMAQWDASLRAIARDGRSIASTKREVVLALLGHHLAAVAPLDTLAAGHDTADGISWLASLARWHRHAVVRRALGRVLTPAEQHALLAARPAARRDVLRGDGAPAPSWG
jgi:hypothetical protein